MSSKEYACARAWILQDHGRTNGVCGGSRMWVLQVGRPGQRFTSSSTEFHAQMLAPLLATRRPPGTRPSKAETLSGSSSADGSSAAIAFRVVMCARSCRRGNSRTIEIYQSAHIVALGPAVNFANILHFKRVTHGTISRIHGDFCCGFSGHGRPGIAWCSTIEDCPALRVDYKGAAKQLSCRSCYCTREPNNCAKRFSNG